MAQFLLLGLDLACIHSVRKWKFRGKIVVWVGLDLILWWGIFFFFCWCFFCGCQIYVNGICWDWQVCAVWDIAWLQVLFAGWFLCLQVLLFSFTLVFPFGVVSFQIDVCVISNANRDDVCLINESFWCSLLQSKSKQTLLRYYEKSRPNFFPLCYDSIVSIN